MCLQVRLLFLKWQGFMSISLKRDKINKKFSGVLQRPMF